ncbi:hypothetical protein KUCAC02_024332, partial [Chaenocephalus aceratus]
AAFNTKVTKGIEFIINTSTNPTNGAEGWNTGRQESGNSRCFAVHIDRTKRIRADRASKRFLCELWKKYQIKAYNLPAGLSQQQVWEQPACLSNSFMALMRLCPEAGAAQLNICSIA